MTKSTKKQTKLNPVIEVIFTVILAVVLSTVVAVLLSFIIANLQDGHVSTEAYTWINIISSALGGLLVGYKIAMLRK